jgi:hypothetical protein
MDDEAVTEDETLDEELVETDEFLFTGFIFLVAGGSVFVVFWWWVIMRSLVRE